MQVDKKLEESILQTPQTEAEESESTDGIDSNEEDSDEEYLFPTPDEIRNAKKPEVGMVFSSLEEAVRFVNVYKANDRICSNKREELQAAEDNSPVQQEQNNS
jgi:hypothetical protein